MSDEVINVNEETVNPSGISHAFDTGYAIAYGVEEAIMIKNLQFFIISNANRGQNFYEGRFWTYDKLEDFPNHFPYWTPKQCRRIVDSLVSKGVLIKGDFNKAWSNRTCWYAFKDQDKFIRNIKPPKEIKNISDDLPKRANENCPNGQMSNAQTGKCNICTSTLTPSIPSSSSLKVPDANEINLMEAKASEDELIKLSKPKRTRTPSEFSPIVKQVADNMINALILHKPNYVPPRILAGFLTHVDYLLRLDKRDPSLAMDVFSWALSDSFWADKMYKPNPAEYLRKQFDQLEMKMKAKPAPKERKFAPCSNDQKAFEKMEEASKRAI